MLQKNLVIKKQIIDALIHDGFRVVDKKDFVIATKKENILYIRSLENIHTELNLRYIIQEKTLKQIGGVDVSELKKLIVEAEKKQIKDILGFVTDKLNWSVAMNDSFTMNNKEIYFSELITDRNEVITLVFLDNKRKDHFFSLEMSYRKFLKLVDTLQYKDLKSYAPKFYELVIQSTEG